MPKAHLMLSAILLLASALVAQVADAAKPPVGSWQGTLDAGIARLRLVLHIEGEAGALKARLDSPDQGAAGIVVDTVSFESGVLKFAIDRLRASYEGTFDEKTGKFAGTFTQGRDMPLELAPVAGEVELPNRPQHPEEPFPYPVEEVFYSHDPAGNTAGSFAVSDAETQTMGHVRLAATLTLPESEAPHPAVVLISGSGAQDRDESLLGHKPFLVLADALTRRGIAVLRFDDRGTAESTGDHNTATSQDFAKDAHAGLLYLRTRHDIDAKKIGLMGHSEGGLIAPMVAAQSDDVAFVVMLAGPGVNGAEVILRQSQLIGKAMGASDDVLEFGDKTNRALFAAIRQGGELSEVRRKLQELLAATYDEIPAEAREGVESREQFVQLRSEPILTPWFRYFLSYDPAPTLTKVKCPVLAVNGALDLQVDPSQNLPAIKQALIGNPDVTILELPGLNHLFQNCETGVMAEYSQIEQTFDPKTLELIGDWIAKRFL